MVVYSARMTHVQFINSDEIDVVLCYPPTIVIIITMQKYHLWKFKFENLVKSKINLAI